MCGNPIPGLGIEPLKISFYSSTRDFDKIILSLMGVEKVKISYLPDSINKLEMEYAEIADNSQPNAEWRLGKSGNQDAGQGGSDKANQLDHAHYDRIAGLQVLFFHQHWHDAVSRRNGKASHQAEAQAKGVQHPYMDAAGEHNQGHYGGLNEADAI
jgi:hypothetical protein